LNYQSQTKVVMMSQNNKSFSFEKLLNDLDKSIQSTIKTDLPLMVDEIGYVTSISQGVATVSGLQSVFSDELIVFDNGELGLVFNLDEDEVGVIMLGSGKDVATGSLVIRTERVADVPVGEALLGRVIDALSNPLDNLGPIHSSERFPIERPAAKIMERSPVTIPMQTGIKVIDALIPIGRGQRELIVGDRQIGKTAIAIDTIINQQDTGVLCVYCAIGQQKSSIAKLIEQLKKHDALKYSIILVASNEDAPGLRYIAPYAATSIAEYFMEKGKDVLIVYDDLTSHARAYREISLLLERPPGREAYPGDIFFIHARLLERSTNLKRFANGGSLTSLPIIETQAQNISSYIVTNLISITDGQIYLSPDLFQKNQLPAIDVGKSVSRVGGKTQLPAYQKVMGDLRLSYAQFEELEMFSRFGTRLDDETKKTINRGRKVRKVLTQDQYKPMHVSEQIAVLVAVTSGVFDDIAESKVKEAEEIVKQAIKEELPDIYKKITEGEKLSDDQQKQIKSMAIKACAHLEGTS
jgi:F-type H+/Na+-transporting ATPase subunit alpha